MEKKKLKLTISGSSKKTIDNIELAKSKGKNSVVIGKKNRFGSKASFLHDQRINPDSGMIYMNKINSLIINPRDTVHFKPGGKHVMIMGVYVDLEIKKVISCFLSSKKGKKFPVSYVIR